MPRIAVPRPPRPLVGPATLSVNWQTAIDDYISALAWSPDGHLLAVAAASGPILLLDGASGEVRRGLGGHVTGTLSLSWRPDGRALASGGQDGQVRLWEVGSDVGSDRALPGSAEGKVWVERVAWSPTGDLLASGAGKALRVWNASGTLAHEYAGHQATVLDLAWRPDGGEVATAAYGGVTIWNPRDPEMVRRFPWTGASLCLAWSPHGRYIATGDQDATVHFWIARDGADLMMRGYETKVRQVAWDHGSRYLATGGNAAVLVWDCAGKGPEGRRPLALEAHQRPLSALAFQHNGGLLISGDPDGRVALWQPAQGRKPRGRAARAAGVIHLAWSPDDRYVAVADEDGGIAVLMAVP